MAVSETGSYEPVQPLRRYLLKKYDQRDTDTHPLTLTKHPLPSCHPVGPPPPFTLVRPLVQRAPAQQASEDLQ